MRHEYALASWGPSSFEHLQVLHDLWLAEGEFSNTLNASEVAAYPVARSVAADMRTRSRYELGFGSIWGYHTSTPLLLKICNQNLLPEGTDALYNSTRADIIKHWRQVCTILQ